MITPGRYNHFKGGTYRVLHSTVDADTMASRVVYIATGAHAGRDERARLWDRLESEFLEVVEWPDGTWQTRFVRVGD